MSLAEQSIACPSPLVRMRGEMVERVRRYPWHESPLGPVDRWSTAFRTAVDLCLGSRLCGCVYAGPDHLVLYNDAYASILGTKHPWALGRRADEVWPEIFDVIGPLMEQTFDTGETTGGDDAAIFLNRSGYVEEFYCSFTYSPLVNEHGVIEGVCATLPETTSRVIGERRLRTLEKLGASARNARSAEEAILAAADIATQNPYDIPFASYYLWDTKRSEARLCATSNIEAGTPLSAERVQAVATNSGRTLAARALACTKSGRSDRLALGTDFAPLPSGAWDRPPESAMVLPLLPRGGEAPEGFIVAGVSPHKRLDPEHLSFFNMLRDQVSGAMSEAHSHQQGEARVRNEERLRLARELHDTILQSMQGMRFLLEAGLAKITSDPPASASYFENALSASIRAVDEGREVLSLLRSQKLAGDASLGETLERLGGELAAGHPVEFLFTSRGVPRALDPGSRDHVIAISREAISNAIRHAQAQIIRLELRYQDRLEVEISDDGRGMSPDVMARGRDGHFGLPGMRERAEQLGARLVFASTRDAGTRVLLLLPEEPARWQINPAT